MTAAVRLDVPERLGYRLKRTLLGKPLVTGQLHEERLTKKSALGVLSSDCISSSAYGTEEMLIFLLPAFGLAGFHILLPLTFVVLAVLLVMTALYRQVVTIYTKAGGSYVVARENFGPRVAQIASVALLIDYIVTVAVQSAAGTAAISSIVPALRGPRIGEVITISVVLLLAYGNLRGVREAGRAFALPTYLFVTMAGLVIVIGVMREVFGDLPVLPHIAGMYPVHDTGHAVLTGASIFVLLKAFANGGASLTGLEAISNGVSAFKEPVGKNARTTLSIMSMLLGGLVLGISYLSFETHATPVPKRLADRHQPNCRRRVRQRLVRPSRSHPRAGRHRAHPLHRCEHTVHRFPVPDQLHRRGLVPAATDDSTWASPGLQQWHHRAHRRRHHPVARGRHRRRRTDPVLRHRSLHRVLLMAVLAG